jgi:hypothetical protein
VRADIAPGGTFPDYELLFSNGGGIPFEHCAVIDDGRVCALEYNVVRWGKTELPPEAGSPSTYGVRMASSLRPASTTTPILRSVHPCSPRWSWRFRDTDTRAEESR